MRSTDCLCSNDSPLGTRHPFRHLVHLPANEVKENRSFLSFRFIFFATCLSSPSPLIYCLHSALHLMFPLFLSHQFFHLFSQLFSPLLFYYLFLLLPLLLFTCSTLSHLVSLILYFISPHFISFLSSSSYSSFMCSTSSHLIAPSLIIPSRFMSLPSHHCHSSRSQLLP